MAADPVVFADKMLSKQPHNECPAKRGVECDRAGTEHEHGQVEWLHRADQPINILIPGNRFGKSVVSAMRHAHHCMFKKGLRPDGKHTWLNAPYETISVAYSADQAQIVFDEVKILARHPAIAPFIKRIYTTPFPRVVFFNGAVLHCRSAHDDGKYIDGHGYRYVSIDEAGYFGQDLKKLINGVILMRLAGGGMLDLIGTPKGFGDLYWYANRGLRGVEGYYTQRGSIFDNPHLSEEDIKVRDRLLEQADPRLRQQVLYGAFVSDEGLAFTEDQLEQAFDKDLPAHQPCREGHQYVQAWDLGRRGDWTVGVTFDMSVEPWEMVDYVRLNRTPWDVIYDLIIAKAKEYDVYSPVIDASGMGGDIVEEELLKRGLFVDGVRINTQAIKTNLINTLQTALDHGRQVVGVRTVLDEAGYPREIPDAEAPGVGAWGRFRMPSIPQLVDEFGVYQQDDKDLVQDSVMAVALAIHSVYDGAQVEDGWVGGIYGSRA
jgi:hypothetical protein